MKKTSLPLISIALSFLSSPPAYGQLQTLFGKAFKPYSETRAKAAFDDLRVLRINRARKLFGTSNGMLADELQMELLPAMSGPVPPAIVSVFDEWLAIYPKIPSGSQRCLARHALYIASEMRKKKERRTAPRRCRLGVQPICDMSAILADDAKSSELADKMISEVLAAAMKNDWFPDKDLSQEFEKLVRDQTLDQNLRSEAATVLATKPLEIDLNFEASLTSAEELVKSGLSLGHVEMRKPRFRLRQVSWYPKFMKSITGSDGRLKELVSSQEKDEVSETILPAGDSNKLTDLLKSLTDLYSKLPAASKEIFTARLFGVTQKLQLSNLQPDAEALFWVVFKSIDSTWLEHNAIECNLQGNGFDRDNPLKYEKVLLKVMELQDMFYGGLPSNANLRWVLGDLYDGMGRYDESKKQYEIAREIDERLVSTSISEADNFMDRDYNIRNGTYVSPYSVDHPLR